MRPAPSIPTQLAILAVAAVLWYQLSDLEYPADLFPRILLAATALLSGVCATGDFLRKRDAESSGSEAISRGFAQRIAITVVMLAGYIALYPRLGFYATTTVFLFLLVLVLRRSEDGAADAAIRGVYAAAAFALLFSLVMYLSFSVMLRVPVPSGLLF